MEEELERWDHSEEVKALEEGEEKGNTEKEEHSINLKEMNDALGIHNVFKDSESDLTQWVTKMTLNRLGNVIHDTTSISTFSPLCFHQCCPTTNNS
eukprot:884295-Ditylum_brightwellii.AAC.1